MQLRSVLILAQVLIDLLGSEPGSGLHPGDPAAQGTQLPLTVDYATTVHKLQGCTTPAGQLLVVQLGDREFAPGLAYVALSRPSRLSVTACNSPSCNVRQAARVALDYVPPYPLKV
jgi:hypothetical protein